ncbi:MAG: extracellular solute-binding protein [Alphaproteobacteria bacterium]|nr:extracellular solute-binding protein [Alphaproteobacteria bacterium]
MRFTSLFKVSVIVVFIALIGWRFTKHSSLNHEDAYVNVYDWYGMLSNDILRQFEKETGIHVRYDLYDNNEVLEAKLLASNSGYDVVFPSASPYVARQIAAGVYQPLNKSLLNIQELDPVIMQKMKIIDPDMSYAIPYYWGTLGIAFDVDRINELLPGISHDSYDLLFNPENLKRLAPYGISFLEEATDVFPLILSYIGKDRDSIMPEDLDSAYQHLLKLRPYIRRFASSRFVNDIVMGDSCIAQGWSGEAHEAIREAKELGRNIKYIVPKEGTTVWVDCLAIPVGAPHPKNAHIFINFLLRPDISAKITNNILIPTTVVASLKLIDENIKNDPSIYPLKETMLKLHLDKPQKDAKSMEYDKLRTRTWAKVRLNR